MHVDMIITYNGRNYQGSQWQSHGNTIENILFEVLHKTRHVVKKDVKFHSRTDKHVSAIMNVLHCELLKWPNIKSLNKLLLPKKIQILAAIQHEPEHELIVKEKMYVYYLSKQSRYKYANHAQWHDIVNRAKAFYKIKNFTAFIKEDKYPRNKQFSITNINIKEFRRGWVIQFIGNGFGWQQVRRMVGFLFDKKYYHETPEKYKNAKYPITIQTPPGDTLLLARTMFNVKPTKISIEQLEKERIHYLANDLPYGFAQVFRQELSHGLKILNTVLIKEMMPNTKNKGQKNK